MALTVGSLFSGIGGIDLGLERAGMESRWFVEWDAHCQNVLRRHWPGLPVYGDITAVDWSAVEPVDVLAGGFPCQPISNAGKRLGTDDERWLWPEFARAIRILRPRYVLVENVAALLGRGFEHVVTDLASLGYDAEWDCIPAAAVGAPHLRDRLWIIAYPHAERDEWTQRREQQPTHLRGAMAHASGSRRDDTPIEEASKHQGQRSQPSRRGEPSPPLANAASERRRQVVASVLGRAESEEPDGAPADGRLSRGRGWWLSEPDVGRVADGVPHRVDRLRALGNAVVPQVVEWIGRRIVAFDAEREAVA